MRRVNKEYNVGDVCRREKSWESLKFSEKEAEQLLIMYWGASGVHAPRLETQTAAHRAKLQGATNCEQLPPLQDPTETRGRAIILLSNAAA